MSTSPTTTWSVYYGVCGNGTCKIGFSSNVGRRAKQIGADFVAAVETVGPSRADAFRLERLRHTQFAELKIYPKMQAHEWFWLGDLLYDHLVQLGARPYGLALARAACTGWRKVGPGDPAST